MLHVRAAAEFAGEGDLVVGRIALRDVFLVPIVRQQFVQGVADALAVVVLFLGPAEFHASIHPNSAGRAGRPRGGTGRLQHRLVRIPFTCSISDRFSRLEFYRYVGGLALAAR